MKKVAQADAEPGGWYHGEWLTAAQIEAAEKRWARRSYREEAHEPAWGGIPYQCGGCRFFAAYGSDYGVCCNEKSPLDGMIVFEHGGCLEHSERGSEAEPKGT